MLVIAHAGHWIESAAMGLPAIAFGAWLAVTTLRERGAGRRSQST